MQPKKTWTQLVLENANRQKCVKQADICLFPRFYFSKYTNLNAMIKKWKNLKTENTITEFFLEKMYGDFVENLYFNFPEQCEQASHLLSDSLCLIEK